MNHGQPRTHKTHHGLDLGEVTTFPLIVYYVPLHEAHIQMTFCPKIPKVGTPVTLEPHNFVCKPLIKLSSIAKLYPSSRAFQRYVARRLQERKLGRFLTFNGRGSNCQFDSQPFVWS